MKTLKGQKVKDSERNSDNQSTSASVGLEQCGGRRLYFPEHADDTICNIKEGDLLCGQTGVNLEG